MAEKIIVAFDVYGTLLSTDSIAKQLAQHFGENEAKTISLLWRRYQLEYTWRLTSMGRYETFSHITRNSLHHALADNGKTLSQTDIERLMEAYDSLATFPDVERTLTRLAKVPNVEPVVFSNGTHAMVSNSVYHSPDLSPYATIFRDIVTVDDVKQFKPAPAVYKHLARKTGKSESQMSQVWLISGNPFDVVGARSVGMNAIWVDRNGQGWKDAAVPELQPTAIVNDLEKIVDEFEKRRD